MNSNHISIVGAKEHNLKNLDIKIPRDKFVVITGLSGSGKSSLAFDTIYAEGQRRYVESLSAYARQFLEQLQKPNVEHIDGLSPTISIEQKTTSRNPRSTVATQTEIYDYLRLLFARAGTPFDPKTGKAIEKQSSQEIVNHIMSVKEGTPITILSPIIRGRKGEYKTIGAQTAKAGFARMRIDGEIVAVEDKITLDKNIKHTIEVVIDRLKIKSSIKKRLTDSIETALQTSDGLVHVNFGDAYPERSFNEKYATDAGFNIDDLEPRLFSFNSPYGACPTCNGLGTNIEIDPELLIPDESKSWVNAIAPAQRGRRAYLMYYRAVLREFSDLYGVDRETPFASLKTSFQKKIFYGSPNDEVWGKPFIGVINYLEKMFKDTDSDWLKDELTRYMTVHPCSKCKGKRLSPAALCVKVAEHNITEITSMSIKDVKKFFTNLSLSKENEIIAEPIIKEILRRVNFCINVGLDYLSLDRKSATLSGGEAERIRLATQVGSGLVGVIYILDEPSIGLHQRDNDRLLNTLRSLRDIGNTLIVVEHDEDTIRQADHVIDIGPGAGIHGGEITYQGNVTGLLKSKKSLTGQYLSGKKKISLPKTRRETVKTNHIKIIGAKEHNLKNINVSIPLQTFTCITGVSGSGKSTLVEGILHKALMQQLHNSKEKPGVHKKIEGIEHIDKVIVVDQSPIGRTPRSNPATYTGVFSVVRDLFSQLPAAKLRGYKPGRFSFNVKGGRCESCQGDGIRKIEMHFLPDVFVECEICKGKRFNEQTLEIEYKDHNIADVLNLSVEAACSVFENIPRIKRILDTLNDVGLGYVKLGQAATTLSGGEAQRVKLSSELCKPSTGKTFYILDEPTTGLHFSDVEKLLHVLQRLVDKNNSILVIEHNLEVIKNADYIIDLGPEGGDKGGRLLCAGTPEEIVKNKKSYTAQYLKPLLK
ncbi:MAG: excinuclease ABC subunit A [Candidatus Omnitrophota bacterium]|jgi:excinuclease ABC subunit A